MPAAAVAIGSAVMAKRSADKQARAVGAASQAQKSAEMAALAEQRRQFDIGQEQLQPFREAEVRALDKRQALTGLLGQEAQRQAIEEMQVSPAVKFSQERQEQALMRQAAATGGLGGGRVLEALQAQSAGFAQQDLQNQLRGLNLGMGATTGAVNLGQAFGGQVAAGQRNIGQATASGIMGMNKAQAAGRQAVVGGVARAFGGGFGGGFF